MEIKKISIVGCGALGMMYASHMLKSLEPEQIQFIAAQDRIERYQKAEFYVNKVRQSFRFSSPKKSGQPSDLVIFTVKFNHLRDAMAVAKNHIGEDTIILSFLNGISSEEVIGEVYNPAKIIRSMVAGMDATKSGYSVDFTNIGFVDFGNYDHINDQEDIYRVARFFDSVSQKYEIQDDIMKSIWWKYILNVGGNQTSALLKSTYGLFQNSIHAETIMRMAMAEAYEISRKIGIGLNDDDVEKCVKTIRSISPDGKTSMCQDMEARRPTEVDIFAGNIMELGAKHNVPVPINTFLFHAIKAMESQF